MQTEKKMIIISDKNLFLWLVLLTVASICSIVIAFYIVAAVPHSVQERLQSLENDQGILQSLLTGSLTFALRLQDEQLTSEMCDANQTSEVAAQTYVYLDQKKTCFDSDGHECRCPGALTTWLDQQLDDCVPEQFFQTVTNDLRYGCHKYNENLITTIPPIDSTSMTPFPERETSPANFRIQLTGADLSFARFANTVNTENVVNKSFLKESFDPSS